MVSRSIYMSINDPFLSYIWLSNIPFWSFLGGAVLKNPPASTGDARDVGLISGSGRSPGEWNGNLFQYSCLGNLIDRGDYPWGSKELDMTERLSTYPPTLECPSVYAPHLFIHSSADGHLGWFHVLAIINRAFSTRLNKEKSQHNGIP